MVSANFHYLFSKEIVLLRRRHKSKNGWHITNRSVERFLKLVPSVSFRLHSSCISVENTQRKPLFIFSFFKFFTNLFCKIAIICFANIPYHHFTWIALPPCSHCTYYNFIFLLQAIIRASFELQAINTIQDIIQILDSKISSILSGTRNSLIF